MRVWRICRRRFAAFDGEGARIAGGRWNRIGTAVVYTSATLSLAALEYFVNVEASAAPDDLVSIFADIPEDVPTASVEVRDLPRDWRRYPAPDSLRDIGTAWVTRGREAVLSVPSAVVPSERNYLINPSHPAFGRIRIGSPQPFSLDLRLWKAR
ncbi:MAG: RES family NAD+ phosphorylase [Acidithiobacillales bacterium]